MYEKVILQSNRKKKDKYGYPKYKPQFQTLYTSGCGNGFGLFLFMPYHAEDCNNEKSYGKFWLMLPISCSSMISAKIKFINILIILTRFL